MLSSITGCPTSVYQPVATSNVLIVRTEIWEVPEIVDASGAHALDMRLTG